MKKEKLTKTSKYQTLVTAHIYKSIKEKKGITLIALIITIIVLLILAGVTISMVLGDNGVLNKAAQSKEDTTIASEQEMVSLAYAGAKTDNLYDSITVDELQNSIDNLIGDGESTVSSDDNETFIITFIATGNSYSINQGSISKMINWDELLANANKNPENYKHSEQLVSEYIGIGTDGEPVNMDLWNPTKLDDGTFSLDKHNDIYQASNVYQGEIVDGRIQGKVPQYIYNEELNSFIEVTSMNDTFYLVEELKYAPEIPSTVTDMSYTFCGCYNLIQASTIPNSVINMSHTFFSCYSLTGNLIINATPMETEFCFYLSSTNSDCNLILSGASGNLSELLATKTSNSNISLK